MPRRELDPAARRRLGKLIWAFIRAGWNPPPPSEAITRAIADDIEEAVLRYAALKTVPTHRFGEDLSDRQFQVLYLTAQGLTAEQVGQRLGIGYESVRAHSKRVREKLDAKTMAQAIANAYQRGIL